MSLLIGVGDFGIGALVTAATNAKTAAEAAAAQVASLQGAGGTTVNTVSDLAAIQAQMGADDIRDVFVRQPTKAKYQLTKTTAKPYATID